MAKARKNEAKDKSRLVTDTVTQVAGEEALPVYKFLKDKKNISEFKIADATNYEVNRIRSMLYKLHEHNLVTYYRKKDRKKGWYISYWTFNHVGVPHIARSLKKAKLEMLTDRLAKEEEHENLFFVCKNLCSRMEFDAAVEHSFKCPECGEIVSQQDNTKTILNLKAKLAELKSS